MTLFSRQLVMASGEKSESLINEMNNFYCRLWADSLSTRCALLSYRGGEIRFTKLSVLITQPTDEVGKSEEIQLGAAETARSSITGS
jgi:hypothetical protein